jgi:ATP-binding cassette, subfamily B, bacterial
MARLRDRNDWKFLGVLFAADRAGGRLVVLVLRGALPVLFAIAMDALVGAVEPGRSRW